MTLVDINGRPLTAKTVPLGVVNENAFHWTRYMPEVYYNPDSITLGTYERMYTTDETVYSGIEFLIMSALARLGEYVHPRPKVQEFVRIQLAQMEGSFVAKVADMMTAAVYGFSLTEIVWRVDGKSVGVADLQTLHPATIHLDLHRTGPRKNKPRTAYQFWRRDHQCEIPLSKAILFSHNGNFSNAYGTSRLKRAYKSWFIKDIILKSWGLCCERYGQPYTIAKTKGTGHVMVNGQQVAAIDHLANVLDSLGAKGSAIIDSEDEIDLKYAAANIGGAFEALVAYCNKMIYRALGLPSLIADNGTVGSNALGTKHFELFVLLLEKLLFDLIECMVEQFVRPMIEMNFGSQGADGYGTFLVESFEEADEKIIAETLNILATAGLVDLSNLDDVNHWRERLGLALWTEEDLSPAEEPPMIDAETDPSTVPPTEDPQDEEVENSESVTDLISYSRGLGIAGRRRANAALARSRRRSQVDNGHAQQIAEGLARHLRTA